MNILPNRLLGTVGEHEDFPVENLSKSHCNTYLASCSHDQKIKFWNIEDIPSIKVDANEKAKKAKNKVLGAAVAKDNFFADMVEGTEDQNTNNDDDSDDDSSDDDASSDDDSKVNEDNNNGDEGDDNDDSGLDGDSDNDDINDDSLNNDNVGDESSDGDDQESNEEEEEQNG